jgi:hypothetical protein
VLVRRGVVDQAAHRLRQRVVVLRDAVGGEAHLVGGLLAALASSGWMMRAGMPTAVAPGRHRLDHHRVAAHLGAIAHGEAAQHLGAGAHHHVAAQRGMPLGALVERGAAQRDALVDGAAVADLGRLADHHAHAVVDEHALTDLGAGVDLDARQPAREVRGEAPSQPAVRPEPVRQPVQHQRVQTRGNT